VNSSVSGPNPAAGQVTNGSFATVQHLRARFLYNLVYFPHSPKRVCRLDKPQHFRFPDLGEGVIIALGAHWTNLLSAGVWGICPNSFAS
jgi:hypothetical protein